MIGWTTTTSWLKKQYFNSLHLLDVASSNISPKCQKIYLFGIQFKFSKEEEKQVALALYQSILWFTYRQDIKFYKLNFDGKLKEIPEITNDIGWGCMLRVGQMMFAQTLRVHAGIKKYSEESFLNEVVSQFVVNQQGKFTIQSICLMGQRRLQKNVGDWYTPADIAYALENLCEEQRKLVNGLKILIYNGEFDISAVLKEVWKKGDTKIKPALLIFLMRIGFQTPQTKLLANIVKILQQQPSTLGILGGRPGKAHYIVGTTDDSFIYLDPHCVKDQKNIQSFFPPSLFTLRHEKIDPSMGACFYVNTLKQLLNLHSYFEKMKDSPIYAYSTTKQKIDYIQFNDEDESFQQLIPDKYEF